MNKEEIIKMYVPNQASMANYNVIKISKNRYQLTNNDPFSEILTYGTIIEVLPDKKKIEEEEIFVFKDIYAESKYDLEIIGLPMYLNKTEMRVVGQMITDYGLRRILGSYFWRNGIY